MTWPGWSDALPLLVTLLAAVAALVGGLAALARMARPWMREAAKDATDDLYERLKSNDFKHVEDRIGDGLRGVNDRLDRAREERRGIAATLDEVRRNVAILADRQERPGAATAPASMDASSDSEAET